MTDEPGAIWLPNNNAFAGRQGMTPRYVLLHGTAGGTSATAIANYFKSTEGGNNPVSANYVIDQAANIVQCNLEADGAYANGFISGTPGTATPDSGNGIRDVWWSDSLNPNLITISIEHCKVSDTNADQLTDAQKRASFTLIRHICERNNIPKRPADATGGITGHYSIDAINRTHCPGIYPWNELFAFLQGGTTVGIPSGWKDDGTTLTGPNGIPVTSGFRDYILTNQWDKNNWPLAPEAGHTPLEISNPTLGGGTQQIFRYTLLEWTPDRGVFVAYIGAELLAWRTAASHPADVLQLQSQLGKATAALNTIEALSSGIVTNLESILATAKSFQPS